MAKQDVIGLAMGLDTSSLKAGLQDAGRKLKEASAEFKASTSGMEDWAKTSEGLSAKLKQLNTNLKVQQAALNLMEKEYKEMYEGQDENSKAAVELRTEILNQKAAIGQTEKSIKKFDTQLEEVKVAEAQVEKAVDETNKSLKDQSKTADDTGNSFENFKGKLGDVAGTIVKSLGTSLVALAASFIGLAEGTREYREDMGKLETAFSSAGHSADSATDTYKKLYGAIGESDTAVEASQQIALLADSEEQAAKWAELATGVVGTFGDALKPETFYEAANETLKLGEATGAFTQMLEGTGYSVDEFNKGLAACSTESEKQAYMLEVSNGLLGDAAKKYNEVNGDVIAARDAQSSLTDALAKLGEIAEPIITLLKNLLVDLLELIEPFVKLIGEGLTGAFNGTAGAADKLAEGLTGMFESLLNQASEMLPKLIQVLVDIIPKVTETLMNSLPELINTLSDLLVQVLNALSEMLPDLIPVIISGILMAVETLLDNIDVLIDAVIEVVMALADGLLNAIPILVEKIPVIITKLIDAISRNLPKIISSGMTILMNLGFGLIKAIPDLLKSIPTIIKSLVSGFGTFKDSLKDVGKDFINGFWKGLKDTFENLKEKIKGLADKITGWFKDVFKINSPSKLMEDEVGKMLGLGVGEGLIKSVGTVKKDINVFNKEVLDGFNVDATPIATGTPGVNTGAVANTNYIQNIYAPQQPSIEDLYRHSKNLFNLKVVS